MCRLSVDVYRNGAIIAKYKIVKEWDLAIVLLFNSKGNVSMLLSVL